MINATKNHIVSFKHSGRGIKVLNKICVNGLINFTELFPSNILENIIKLDFLFLDVIKIKGFALWKGSFGCVCRIWIQKHFFFSNVLIGDDFIQHLFFLHKEWRLRRKFWNVLKPFDLACNDWSLLLDRCKRSLMVLRINEWIFWVH